MKYPRTYHLPWSPGATSDDKKLSGDWFKYYKGKDIVVTIKLDGENTAMTKNGVYARSHSSETRSPWSENLWNPINGLYWTLKPYIGDDEILFGENLYGIHSIEYNKLPNYWHLITVCNSERFYSWDEVIEFSNIIKSQWSLEGQCVPEVFRGKVESEDELKSIIDRVMLTPIYGEVNEGVVVRLTESFPINEFSKNVFKYVRANHVQTDEHWTKNWKKANLWIPKTKIIDRIK